MVYYKLTLGKYNCIYQFDKEVNDTTDLPYCDADKNILDRINETLQEKMSIDYVNKKVAYLENKAHRTPEEEEDLKLSKHELNIRTEISSYKAYYINKDTGEKHLKAFKLLGDIVLDGSDGRTKEIPEGEYVFCDIGEHDIMKKGEKGTFVCQELYDVLKAQNKAIKFNMKFGIGNNEERVYVYPDKDTPNALIMNKTGRTKFKEVMIRNLEELKKYEELKEILKAIDLEEKKKSRNKVAGSLD